MYGVNGAFPHALARARDAHAIGRWSGLGLGLGSGVRFLRVNLKVVVVVLGDVYDQMARVWACWRSGEVWAGHRAREIWGEAKWPDLL